ncbi:MAG: catalase [Burkholderia contaminans]|jgi:catalase|uniref:Catalase n=1 Tax=Burkholderia contaminans TaxID=488447 RepID=A0AAP4RAS2_9BURK|nr:MULTISPECIES: catalase [Burkholderia]MBD1414765.1 catalase [Burkholderia contaminans]MBH9672853.1 catalase [Burkholderia contaminans]MBH9680228.1 catalase [Burkholderia contaminans]MBH9710275.1 catalase [Burkholderia contaminans]MBM6431396.1 catalase [Burkholderia contaminans]
MTKWFDRVCQPRDRTRAHVNAALSGDNAIIRKAGPGDSAPLQDVWRDRAVILAQRMHARGVGAYDTFAVTDEIGRYTRAETVSAAGEQTLMFACFPTVSGRQMLLDSSARQIVGVSKVILRDKSTTVRSPGRLYGACIETT